MNPRGKLASRRDFIKSLGAGALLAASPTHYSLASVKGANSWPIAVFGKPFENLDFTQLADAIAQTGADGLEATIRPEGHIEPENAASEVPKMQEALQKKDKCILIAATRINNTENAQNPKLLQTLVDSGVKYYRMGYYRVDHEKPLLPQLDHFRKQAESLAAANESIGIQGIYQTHSGGRNFGNLGWDLATLLEGINPNHIGVALDTRHLIKTSGTAWRTVVGLLKSHIRSVYVKDGRWFGERGDQFKDVPLDEGFVNQGIFDYIMEDLPQMPICLHMEWMGYRAFEKHEMPEVIKAHQRDLKVLNRWLSAYKPIPS